MKIKDKQLIEILRFWVYPTAPKRSDRWIMGRALFDALKQWAGQTERTK